MSSTKSFNVAFKLRSEYLFRSEKQLLSILWAVELPVVLVHCTVDGKKA